MEDLTRIERDAVSRAQKATTRQDIALIRSEVLGKKGFLGAVLRSLGDLPAASRPVIGEKINAVRTRIDAALDEASQRIDAVVRDAEDLAGRYDVTLPGRRALPGSPHPLRVVEQDVIRCLAPLGFTVAEGPLVEHDWYNFEALNIPPEHPARDMQDTFFVAPRVVLRTHTSNVQIRTMVRHQPPVRILSPGMVFRHDEVDATHSPAFHQMEGLWIDDQATFADLKGVLRSLTAALFGPNARTRFRPSFFPFTEPSTEVDVSCGECGETPQAGCRICKGTGWLEILGAGMVDPAVLQAVGYDPDKVQGFAFGVGLDRLALLRWGIDDIRLLYENDVRFLRQIAGSRS